MKCQQVKPGEPLFLTGYGPGHKSARQVSDEVNAQANARRAAEAKVNEELAARTKADPEWATRPSKTLIIPKGGIYYGR